MKYKNIQIKQHSKVTYLGCILDETMSGESMVLKVTNKTNSRLKFLHRKNKILTPTLRRLLCNALIEPHFDYASSAWYPNLTHIFKNEFESLNWLPVKNRFNESINSIVFKYFAKQCSSYLNKVSELAGLNNLRTRNRYLKLICPFGKNSMGQNVLSFVGPSIWNKTPEVLKNNNSINTFKHNLNITQHISGK